MADTKETIGAEKEYTELIPPENHPELGLRVFEVLAEVIANKADLGLPETWCRYYELRRNKHWKKPAGSTDTVNLVSANLLGTHHVKTVNLLTDNNPTFDVAQTGAIPDDKKEYLDNIVRLADHWWSDQEQQSIYEESVHTGETYGSVAEGVRFTTEIDAPFGEIESFSIDPFYFGMYPVKCRKVQKATAILYYYPMNVVDVKRKWPALAEEVKPDAEILNEIGDIRNEPGDHAGSSRQSMITRISSAIKSLVKTADTPTGENEVLICEMWVKDYTQIPDPTFKIPEDADPNAKPQIPMVNRYKGNIRRVQVCNAGELVLGDHDNPSINPEIEPEEAIKSYLWDKFPFSFNVSIIDPASPWGLADYEQLEALNKEANITLSQYTLYKNKASRLKLVNPLDSGVDNSEFDDYPGIIRPASSLVAQGIRYLDPPASPVDLVNAFSVYKDLFFTIAGTFDLESAQTPGKEVIAYKAIAALLENTTRMMKGKIRNYSKMLRERGRMFYSLAQNWYTDERWIAYKEEGERQSMKIDPKMLWIPAKLTVVSGSTMPKSQIQKREEALELRKMGAIDDIALLQALDYPNWREIVKRMQQGPIGMFLEMLAAAGVPPPVIEYFGAVQQLEEPEKVQRAVEKGELPGFLEVLTALMGSKGNAPPELPISEQMEAAAKKAEAVLKTEQANEVKAKTKLTMEKQRTEQVEQLVKMEGINFDKEKIKMMRAELISKITGQGEELDRKSFEAEGKVATEIAKAKQKKTGPYSERGLSSNNE